MGNNQIPRRLLAFIEREAGGHVALCPELDIASQGDMVEAARDNLKKALELFFEAAPAEEVARRPSGEVESIGPCIPEVAEVMPIPSESMLGDSRPSGM